MLQQLQQLLHSLLRDTVKMNYNDKVLDGEAMKRTRLLMRGKDNDDDQAIFNVIV